MISSTSERKLTGQFWGVVVESRVQVQPLGYSWYITYVTNIPTPTR